MTPRERAKAARKLLDRIQYDYSKLNIYEFHKRREDVIEAAIAEAVADWMMDHSIATGHGDTTADLLSELAAHCRSAGWDDAVKALRGCVLSNMVGRFSQETADWLAANKPAKPTGGGRR